MKDHDGGFQPQFDMGELPKGAQLFMQMKAKLDQSMTEAARIIEAERAQQVQHLTEAEIADSRAQLYPDFKDIKYSLFGSDEVSDIGMFAVGGDPVNHKLLNITFELRRDGSPYVPDEFTDQVGPHDSSLFVFVGPEIQPFIVTSARLDETSANEHGITGNETRYLEELQELGHQPRWLTDDEADQLMGMLPLLEIDPERQSLNAINLYLPKPELA